LTDNTLWKEGIESLWFPGTDRGLVSAVGKLTDRSKSLNRSDNVRVFSRSDKMHLVSQRWRVGEGRWHGRTR
jgi:hypothetical protein